LNTDGAGSDIAFIIGAGRSGTTLVHKALCMHPRVAWISNHVVKLPLQHAPAFLSRIVKHCPNTRRKVWYSRDGNAFLPRDSVFWRKLVPTPVEGEKVYTRCGIPAFASLYWRISARQAHCLRKYFAHIKRAQGADVFISKRTANNRRLPQLLEAFPCARFIHVVRDGRAVAASLLGVYWWQDHKVWWLDQRTPQQWEKNGGDPVELAARNWVEEMRELETGMRALPAHQVISINYEAIVDNALDTWITLARFLGLNRERSWLDEVARLCVYDGNKTWAIDLTRDGVNVVTAIQKETLMRYGYGVS
jgi:hypothetical protein